MAKSKAKPSVVEVWLLPQIAEHAVAVVRASKSARCCQHGDACKNQLGAHARTVLDLLEEAIRAGIKEFVERRG